jgi:carbon storage regulator
MLVLARKVGQSIEIAGGITITVVEVRGEQVRVGIAAPKSITVNRTEIIGRIASSATNA